MDSHFTIYIKRKVAIASRKCKGEVREGRAYRTNLKETIQPELLKFVKERAFCINKFVLHFFVNLRFYSKKCLDLSDTLE